MEFLQTVVGFLVVLIILVSVHEFGHFIVARLCGVKVLRFCVGLGKPIWSRYDRSGTEFAIAAFPLGGYVKMLDEREGDVAPAELHRAFNRKSVWQRIAILAAGAVANFILAIVVFWGLYLQGTTDLSPVIGEVRPGSIAERAGLEEGQEILAVDGVNTPTRQAVVERLLMRLGESGTLEFTVRYPDAPSLQYESDVVLDEWLKHVDEPDPLGGLGLAFYRPEPKPVIAEVLPGSAAEKAGLKAGDELLTVDGQPVTSWNWWVDYVQDRPEQSIQVQVLREDSTLSLQVVPTPTELDNGQVVGRLGVMVEPAAWPEHMVRKNEYSVMSALGRGMEKTWDTAAFVLISMKKLVVGEISTKNLSGPIGIAKVAGDSARAGMEYYIGFLALLSVYLGVLNLLPIPVLDGGHIVYCLMEAIKGSPVSDKLQMLGYQAGLLMLVGVMVLAFYNDILRL